MGGEWEVVGLESETGGEEGGGGAVKLGRRALEGVVVGRCRKKS